MKVAIESSDESSSQDKKEMDFSVFLPDGVCLPYESDGGCWAKNWSKILSHRHRKREVSLLKKNEWMKNGILECILKYA